MTRTAFLSCFLVLGLLESVKGSPLGLVATSLAAAALFSGCKIYDLLRPLWLVAAATSAISLSSTGLRFDIVLLEALGFWLAITSFAVLCFKLCPKMYGRSLYAGSLAAATAWCAVNCQSVVALYGLSLGERAAGVGYIQRGVWGDPNQSTSDLNIQSQYASSKFVRTIGADVLKADRIVAEDIAAYKTLVLFTPTHPFERNEIDALKAWVAKGGSLLVFADHTDLYGHASVLTPLLRGCGITINKDAVVTRGHKEASYWSSWGDLLVGLTPCSFKGRGDALFWSFGFSETADYGGHSFFGDLSPTDGDRAGLHLVGLRCTLGLGQVICFGDSTFFSDFALSRYSSQKALERLSSSTPAVPLYDIALLVALIFLTARTRGRRVLVACAGGLMLGAVWLSPPIFKIKTNPDPLEVEGDPLLTDRESSPLAALWAAEFYYNERGLAWKRAVRGSSTLRAGGEIFTQSARGSHSHADIKELCAQELPIEIKEALSAGKPNAIKHYGSMWFDDGPGYVREKLFEAFWLKKPASMKISDKERHAFDTLNGRKLETCHEVNVYWLGDNREWAILGAGIVARWLPEERILIARKSWQFSEINVPTFIIHVP